MDFDLSADQEALREAARALLDRYASRDAVRARVGEGVIVGTLPQSSGGADAVATVDPAAGAASGYDQDLWKAMAEQGWLAVERPEDEGGLGLGMVEVAILCEEIGRRVAPAPFLPGIVVLDALEEVRRDVAGGRGSGSDSDSSSGFAAATPEWAQGWIDRLSGGAAVGAVAWSSREGELDPVVYGPSADLVVAVLGSSLVAFEVPAGRRSVPQPAMDRTRELGWMALDKYDVRAIGGPAAVERLVNRAATAVSAEMLGAAARVLEMSVEYASERVQFGRPIGSFQAVKHELADALVDVEGMRSTAYFAAWCTAQAGVGADDPAARTAKDPPGGEGGPDHASEAALAASMAKAWCSDAARRVMATGLQVHGGIGFTWEHDMHLYLKRSQLDQVSFGDSSWHRDRISAILQARLNEGRSIF